MNETRLIALIVAILGVLMLSWALYGCGSSTTEQCWGDHLGNNCCTDFVQQHFYTAPVAISKCRDTTAHSAQTYPPELGMGNDLESGVAGQFGSELGSHVTVPVAP